MVIAPPKISEATAAAVAEATMSPVVSDDKTTAGDAEAIMVETNDTAIAADHDRRSGSLSPGTPETTPPSTPPLSAPAVADQNTTGSIANAVLI